MDKRRRRRRKAFKLEIPWRQCWPLMVIAAIGLIVLLTPRDKKAIPHHDETPAETSAPALIPGATPAQPTRAAYVEGPMVAIYDDEAETVFNMPLETYLVGVVSGEVPVSFADETIKAQAVAARTYSLRKVAALGGAPCGRGGADLCTDSAHCQAYRSDAQQRQRWGADYEANRARMISLVQATAGEIITYEGAAIEAFYHSTSGGRTENSENAFSAALPYLRSVESPGEEDAPRFRGETNVSRANFVKKVNQNFSKARLTENRLEKDVEVLSRFESGRVSEVRLGKAKATGKDLRRLFDLDSINFSISFEKDSLVFSTLGYGHGVGMSQTGADYMARAGLTYDQILLHYYTGTKLSAVYGGPT